MRTTFILILCAVCLSACSGNAGNTNSVGNANAVNAATSVNSNTAASGYPQETKDAFVRSCENAGGNRAFCSCVLAKMESKYSLEEFALIEEQIQAGKPSDEFIQFSTKARADCEK